MKWRGKNSRRPALLALASEKTSGIQGTHFHALLYSVVAINYSSIFYLFINSTSIALYCITEDGRSFCGNIFFKTEKYCRLLKIPTICCKRFTQDDTMNQVMFNGV